jgi:7-cyano-7-deazaguanine reductase
MPKAEGKRFKTEKENAIKAETLEAIAHKAPCQKIKIRSDEFSAVCPFSGLPDIATVLIEYIPDGKIIELKSLKYYFMSFRSVGIYQEKATARIIKDLVDILSPKQIRVETIYNTRGGMDVSCVMVGKKK